MAIQSETPYGAFNFLVSIEGSDPHAVQAGFSEVSGLSMEVQVIEYRAGNNRSNTPVKIPGLTKYAPVTLKRGLIGSLDLFEWITQSANSGRSGQRNITIELLNEDNDTVFTWKLRNAWVSNYTTGDLNANSSEIAIETVEVVHEGLIIE
ncbi:phage tail protein [Candidatus Thiodiazotropha sp. CDECU1]|uniref:phage tail protein n=1 Tax=Candidatus Thiodiazotropha sp. CDECU1 TaxID=3065865 RepID=UPI00292F84D8|nr:phage tail protein [Candidatus Thiodiazotropha sp. CDECU1]